MGSLGGEKRYVQISANERWLFHVCFYSDPEADIHCFITKQANTGKGFGNIEGESFHKELESHKWNFRYFENFLKKFVRDGEYRESLRQ